MHTNCLRTPWHKFAKGLTLCMDDCSLDSLVSSLEQMLRIFYSYYPLLITVTGNT